MIERQEIEEEMKAMGASMRADAEELAQVAQEMRLDDPLAGRILNVRSRVLAAAFFAESLEE